MPIAAHELKQLYTRHSECLAELRSKEQAKAELNLEINRLRSKLESINGQIRQLEEENKDVIISEHALLRYFERVLGFDLQEIRSKILAPETQVQIKTLGGSGRFPNDGMTLVVKRNVVTSIITKDATEV